MRIRVDSELCSMTHQCVHSAPRLFRLRPDGAAEAVAETVDGDDRIQAQGAARRCPVQAIEVTEDTAD